MCFSERSGSKAILSVLHIDTDADVKNPAKNAMSWTQNILLLRYLKSQLNKGNFGGGVESINNNIRVIQIVS